MNVTCEYSKVSFELKTMFLIFCSIAKAEIKDTGDVKVKCAKNAENCHEYSLDIVYPNDDNQTVTDNTQTTIITQNTKDINPDYDYAEEDSHHRRKLQVGLIVAIAIGSIIIIVGISVLIIIRLIKNNNEKEDSILI